MPHVDRYPVDSQHPRQRVIGQSARQRPVWIERADIKHLSNGGQLGRAAALADSKSGIDIAQAHVRRLVLVVQKIHPANRADDPAGPRARTAAVQRRRTPAGQLLGQDATERGVFLVQMRTAERINQFIDGSQNRIRLLPGCRA